MEDTGSAGDASVAPADEVAEDRYKRRIGITLAVLAMLGAWIAVLATNAGTEEARTVRQATRLASESETAAVLDTGLLSAIEQIEAELEVLPEREAFSVAPEVASDAGLQVTDDQQQAWTVEAQESISNSLGAEQGLTTDLATEARYLKLLQSATVQERITWNARASQYETVLTVLAVALFLVGFTLAVGRKIRPPIAVPGLVLAVICFGWSLQIYVKPVPRVNNVSVASTADGDVATGELRFEDALGSYDAAIAANDAYGPAYQGRGTAKLVAANPDLLNTLAFTDTDPTILAAAQADVSEALSLDPTDQRAQAVTSLASMMATDWDQAASDLDDAVETNGLSPTLQLWRSAVAVAQGDADTAQEWLTRVQADFKALQGTDVARRLPAQYLSLLEWIIVSTPEQAELAERFRLQGVAELSDSSVDGPLEPIADLDAGIEVLEARFDDGKTTVDVETVGVPSDATVTIAGYERPAADAAYVQTDQLFYVGPASEGGAFTFDTPRACAPVEFRFDLYVEGVFVESVTAPGAAATC